MRQVGADRGDDASAQAPGGQPWYWLVPAAGVQYHHGRSPDQPVHRERQQPRRHPGLAMRAHEFVRVLYEITAATTATATTASAVVVLMSRSVTGPAPHASR